MLSNLYIGNHLRMALVLWLFFFAFLTTDFAWRNLSVYAERITNEITDLVVINNPIKDDDNLSLNDSKLKEVEVVSALKQFSRRSYIPEVEQKTYKETGLLLVATVDGALHGVDAVSGSIKWSQEDLGVPLITTNYHFSSPTSGDSDDVTIDDIESFDTIGEIEGPVPFKEIYYLPEPAGPGTFYYINEKNLLGKSNFTLKRLIDLAPFNWEGRSYEANKRSSFISIDPKTGDILNKPGKSSSNGSNSNNYPPFSTKSSKKASNPIMIGFTDYEIQVYDEATKDPLWSVTLREFVSDKRADFTSLTPKLSQRSKPMLDVNSFPCPVIYAFDVLIEDTEVDVGFNQGTLLAKQVPFSDLDIPSGQLLNPDDQPEAYIIEYNNSKYALTPQYFPYIGTSKFSKSQSVDLPDSKELVLFHQSNSYKFKSIAGHGSVSTILQDKPQHSIPDKTGQFNWFKKGLWLLVAMLCIICGVNELKNNKLLKKFEGTSNEEEPKNKRDDQEYEPFKVFGPNRAQHKPDGTTVINTITITSTVLGYGSQGTIVYKGQFQGREVAVKRMIKDLVAVAEHEVNTLEDSDSHPNVIRYFCMERCEQFMYLALELCPTSLRGLIEEPDKLSFKCSITPQEILYQIMLGIHHLHTLKIVHRDIKPHNILIACGKDRFGQDRKPRVLISDFGLCKKLEEDQSSFHNTIASGAATGTMGWRAPEILTNSSIANELMDITPPNEHSSSSSHSTSSITLPASLENQTKKSKGRITRAVDIFSAGCVFYYVLTGGSHPFGGRYSRESRVVEGRSDLRQLTSDPTIEFQAEAYDLISQMIHADPAQRPDSRSVLIHPYFWDASKKLSFLQDVSDHLEAETRSGFKGIKLEGIEDSKAEIMGENWQHRLDKSVLGDLLRFRGYDGTKISDLLRAIRNKKHHYHDLPPYVKKAYGPLPHGYLDYFLSRFPSLLMHTYYTLAKHPTLPKDPIFKSYFQLTGNHQ